MAGVPAGGGALLAGGPRGYPAWPPVPVLAGATGGAAGGLPGGEGGFFPAPGPWPPASGFGGVPAGAAVFFPAGPRGYPPCAPAPGFASLVKSGGSAPGGFSPY